MVNDLIDVQRGSQNGEFNEYHANAAVKIPVNRGNLKKHASKAFDHRISVICEQCDDLGRNSDMIRKKIPP